MTKQDIVDGLRNAPRIGTGKDEPEGARYIQISDTLVQQWIATLESLWWLPALHASAPPGYKCADCQMDGEACPPCYTAWWKTKHPEHIETTERYQPGWIDPRLLTPTQLTELARAHGFKVKPCVLCGAPLAEGSLSSMCELCPESV